MLKEGCREGRDVVSFWAERKRITHDPEARKG